MPSITSSLIVFLIFFSSKCYGTEIAQKKSDLVVPAFSYLIPGLGSFLENDYKEGSKFLLYGLTGFGIHLNAEEKIHNFRESDSLSFHHYRDLERQSIIGNSMLHHSMMLSTYDSFLTRSKYRQEYTFLPTDQNINTILAAPFKFDYLKRWTTFIPFSLAILIGSADYNRSPKPANFELRPIDGAASSYVSYVAGTGEEAFFRGWMYPVLYQKTNSYLISNIAQGTAFGFAHGPEPYFQLAFGYYAGWLNQRNNFDIGEITFIHAWWNFWVIGASYARSRSNTRDYDFQLAPFQMTF